jgi:hypothetical protein
MGFVMFLETSKSYRRRFASSADCPLRCCWYQQHHNPQVMMKMSVSMAIDSVGYEGTTWGCGQDVGGCQTAVWGRQG